MQDAKQPGSKPGWLKIILIGRQPKLTLLRIAVLVVGCVIIFKFVLLPIQVSGISMEPTYHDRHVNCVNRLAYRWHDPSAATWSPSVFPAGLLRQPE